jgi:flagellin
MIITHNINALYVNNKLKGSVRSISKSMEKLSSGLRIGSASDDSAGLAISEKMRMQIRGLEQASRNIQDGISLVQTADGGLENILTPPLQRMRQLALQSANGTLTAEDRQNLNKEFNEMKDSIDSIANNTEFNGIKLLNFQAVDSTENSIIQKPALREINWTYVDDGDDFTAKDIVYNNDGKYVAIGFKRDNNSNDVMYNEIMYSDDAKNWTKSDFEAFPSGIIYGNGVFVATGGNGSSVGSDGGVMQSNDGINWTRIFNTSIPIDPNYFSTSQNGIAFDGSKFTMVGYDSKNGLSKTLTSTDGLNWQVYDNPDKVGSICYDGEKFIGIGYSSIYTSEDGISWTKQGNLIGYNASDSIAYLGGKYFIFGEPNGTYFAQMMV